MVIGIPLSLNPPSTPTTGAPKWAEKPDYRTNDKVNIPNSYSTVARDLSLKTIPRLRAQPEGERLFSTINPMATVL